MPTKILLLNNRDSFVYNIMHLLESLQPPVEVTVATQDDMDFDNLAQYHALILSPGPGVPSEHKALMRLLNECHTTHPILGICLGHQAIAEFFGAQLLQLPSPLHGHLETLEIKDLNTPLLKNLPQPSHVGLYHSWAVDPQSICVPQEEVRKNNPPLKVTATDSRGTIMALSHNTLPVFGLQFHPESIISNCGRQILENFIDLIAKH